MMPRMLGAGRAARACISGNPGVQTNSGGSVRKMGYSSLLLANLSYCPLWRSCRRPGRKLARQALSLSFQGRQQSEEPRRRWGWCRPRNCPPRPRPNSAEGAETLPDVASRASVGADSEAHPSSSRRVHAVLGVQVLSLLMWNKHLPCRVFTSSCSNGHLWLPLRTCRASGVGLMV
jgi:hypothetical protein